MNDSATIIATRAGRAGHLLLNRPRALNALDLPMIAAMTEALTVWRDDPAIELVVVTAAGERGFCAGGDIRAIRDAGIARDMAAIEAFFSTEYRLNQMIADYPKPYVALIDGICMGGGIGISVHGSHRVASEKALFAMPETGIALFPDVGTSYVLPRMKHHLGYYVGLTGTRVVGADAVHVGFATDFVDSSRFADLLAALCDRGIGAVAEFAQSLPSFTLAPQLTAIDHAFSAPNYDGIVARLRDQGDFGAQTLAVLDKMSPSSLLWSFALLKAGETRGLPDCLAAELRLTARVVPHHEFLEGVRAMIVDKDRNPQWQPATLAEVDRAAILRML